MLVFGMMMITHCCHAVNNHFKILEMLEMDKCVVNMFKTVRHSCSRCLSALWLLCSCIDRRDEEMKE